MACYFTTNQNRKLLFEKVVFDYFFFFGKTRGIFHFNLRKIIVYKSILKIKLRISIIQ